MGVSAAALVMVDEWQSQENVPVVVSSFERAREGNGERKERERERGREREREREN